VTPLIPQPPEQTERPSQLFRLARIREGEASGVLLSALFFFLLLFGYFLIRPVREAMGVERSMGDLRALFITTCVLSLGVTLLFGSAVSRLDRSRFIPIAMRVVIACLVGFAAWRLLHRENLGVWSGYVFYVWLSIINLFMVSVFWAFMVDVFSLEQSKRLFPAIAIGGTVGALLGSAFAWQLADRIGPVGQMLLAAGCFELAVHTMKAIDRRSIREAKHSASSTPNQHEQGSTIGGGWIDGASAILRSPYLIAIGCWIVLMAVSSTLIYFTQARLVTDAADELEERIALFAQLDMWTQLATLLVQAFLTARLIRWLGVGGTLAILPIVTVLGFAGLALAASSDSIEAWQLFAVFAVFNALHRATRYAVSRPARETLFAVVPRAEKYKAKPVVDVFLYRGGDVAGTGVDALLASAAIGLTGMAMAAAPLAALWGGLSLWLAMAQRRRAHTESPGSLSPTPPAHTGAHP